MVEKDETVFLEERGLAKTPVGCGKRLQFASVVDLHRRSFGRHTGRGGQSLGVHQDAVFGGESRLEQAVHPCVGVRNVGHAVSPWVTQPLNYSRKARRAYENSRCGERRWSFGTCLPAVGKTFLALSAGQSAIKA